MVSATTRTEPFGGLFGLPKPPHVSVASVTCMFSDELMSPLRPIIARRKAQ